jgi:hypothetical protein
VLAARCQPLGRIFGGDGECAPAAKAACDVEVGGAVKLRRMKGTLECLTIFLPLKNGQMVFECQFTVWQCLNRLEGCLLLACSQAQILHAYGPGTCSDAYQ